MAFDIQGYHEKYKDLYGDVPLDEVAKDAFTRGGYDKEYPDYDTWKKATGIEGDIQTDLKKRTPKTWEDKLSEGVANVTPGFIPKDISTSFVKGATLNYVPSVETPADAGILRKGAAGAAHLAGMSVPIGIAALALPEAATVGGVILTSGALGGLYGLLRKPEEGEGRLSNAAKDAAMFATFGVGGKVIGAGLKKLFPETVGKVFEKIAAKQELTPGEKAIYSASQYGSSATLGMGAGATESADTWEQRLQNIAVGGITFAGAHGISSNLMKLVREGKATPDQLEYIKKLEAGANTSTVIDEGLKTGKIGEEVFTPNHALELIKTANDSGVYSTEDVAKLKDRYENKYPDLKKGLNDILKDSIKNEISFGIDVGLKAGRLRGRDFTSDDALEVIKDGREKGIYTDTDIDSFRDKYPTLKQGLNDIVVDSAKNKVNEALKISPAVAEEGKKTELNKIIPKRNIETDVPLKLGEPVDEIIKTKVSREIIDLQTNIAKREKYLAGNKAFEGTDMYRKNTAVLGQDRAKLVELTKPAEAIIPPEEKKPLEVSPGVPPEANKGTLLPPDLKSDNVFARMPEEQLRPLAEQKVQGAVDEFARRSGTTPEINPLASAKTKLEGQPNTPEIVQPVEKVEGKQPWEMTKAEYISTAPREKKTTDAYLAGYHSSQVRMAVKQGDNVPPEVLKDYPNLAKPDHVADAGKVIKWQDNVMRRIDQNVFKDIVSPAIQKDGQRVIDAANKGDIETLKTISQKYVKDVGRDQGGGGAGPGKVKQARRGASAVYNTADWAIRQIKNETAKTPSKTAEPAKRERGAQNLVTKVKELGGWNPGSDYNARLLRQDPDSKRVLNIKNGLTSDQIASILKADGWPIDSGDHVAELLKSGQGRKVFPPDKADVLNDREVKRQEKEWADAKVAEYDAINKEYSDAQERGELPEVEKRLKGDISETAREKGLTEEQSAAEVEDFFTAIADARQLENNRRANYPNRKLVSEMTPDERATALLTDHLTGQKNKRAYEEAERKPYQASLDVDGLKYVNDTFGHEAGNELLKSVGETLNRASEGKDNYHFHGDEFVLEGKTPEELTAVIEKAKQILKDEPLEFNGQKYTADFSHGIAKTMKEADKLMREDKAARKVERGVKPKGDIQPNLKGLSPEETFTLNNPETEISPKLSEQVKPKNEEMFTEKNKENEPVHEFSSTQLNIPDSEAKMVRDFAAKIPDNEIYEDPADPSSGREKKPHITVKYGLHTEDAKDVENVISAAKPLTVTLGPVSIFKGDESDVVKIDLTGDALVKLNKTISDSLENTDTHKDYNPHITIAYVKKGEGEKYTGDKTFEGKKITLNELVFSGKNGTETTVQLKGKPIESARDNIQDFGEKIGGARKDIAERGYTMGNKPKPEEGEQAWRKKYVAMAKVDGSGWTIGKKGDTFGISARTGQKFATQEEAEKAIPLFAVAEKHFAYLNNDGTYSIYKKTGERKRLRVVNQNFPSREEAMKYMVGHAEELLNLKTSFGEEILPTPEKVYRSGVERRNKPATPEMFTETFKPRGIEFGNWNNQVERQEVMNHAYDGLLDLADALKIPPKALMLNGDLAIAFGARGQGLVGAKAHYERDYGVINLTKMKGAGSLAHEWLHAFDHYLGRLDTKASSEKIKNKKGDMVYPEAGADRTYLSSGAKVLSKLRPEVKEAYKTLIEGMYKKAEQYVEDTKQADKFVGTTREELKKRLAAIRINLEKDLVKEYTWRKNKRGLSAASAEQLADYDRLANILVEGGDLETKWKQSEKARWGGYQTNDTLEAISKILKDVRGRAGFNSEHTGTLDYVRNDMSLYDTRLKMFTDAKAGTEKTKKVPTSYAIESRKMDQARAGDYWSEPHEMAARAFSSFVEDKIAESGGQSDFLVYHAHGGISLPMIDGYIARPYPEGKERVAINETFQKFIDTLKVKEEGEKVALYSGKNQPGNVTIDTIKNHPRFKSATVTENEDGSAQVLFRNGDGFKVDFITDMADKGVKLETSYGNFKKDASKKVAGAYVEENKAILFNKDRAGIPTIDHEHIHFLEKSGYLDNRDTRILNMGAKRSGFETTEEGRADFVAQAFQKRDEQVGIVKQVLQKIGDFFDIVMNAVGHRTTGGVLRDIESGKIMEAKGEKISGMVPVSYSLQNVGKSIDALKDKLNKTTDKVETIKNAKDGFGLAYDGAKRAFYPSSRTEAANKAAENIISQMGKNFHQQALLKGKLNEVVSNYRESTSVAAKTLDLMQTSTGILADGIFNKMPKEEQWDFIYRIQSGQKQENPELQGIADTLSKMYDDLYRDSESVTPGAVKYRKGYFPGMWEDATAAEKFFSDRLKNMEGSKAFLKEKIFDDIQAGIEAGLKPKGTPIDMAFAKMHEVQKYVTTHRVLQEMEADKTAILVKSGEREPAGYVFVPEPYGVVTRKEKVNLAGKQMDLSKEIPGTPKMESYRYAVKDDVAQVFQNYLSRSLYENKYVGKVYEGYMNAANTLNQFQLGVGSAFHAGFTTMEAVISKFALGVKAMARGDVPEAVKLMAASPLQVYKNPALGDKLLRAYRGESVTGQEIPQLVKWLEMAGGRATMDSRFRTSSTDKMIEAWTKGNKISAALRSPFAVVEQMARPILEWLVPRQKFGVFAEMATEWHKQNPNATHEETRTAMQYVWNRVDSRLGQVVYERLFTQNVAKNIVQGLVRAPGWSGGTIIEIGGGVNDFAKVFNDIAHGRKPQMTDKMAYTISLLTITGLINGVMTKLLTGENPQDGMDLLAFRTGKIDERGNPERFLLPTYAKDIYAYINKPGTTLLNKSHPMLSLMADIAKNKDYYGVAVRDKESNLAVQAGQTGLYAAKAFVPFWMRGTQKAKERGDDLASMLSPLIGIMPATAEFTKTKAQKLMSEILQERPKGSMSREKFETNQLKNKLETRLRNHDPEAPGDIQQYLKDGKLSRKDVMTIQKAVRTPYLVNAFKPLSLKEAMRVYSVATPEEKKIFLPLLRKKSHLLRDLPEEERRETLINLRQVING